MSNELREGPGARRGGHTCLQEEHRASGGMSKDTGKTDTDTEEGEGQRLGTPHVKIGAFFVFNQEMIFFPHSQSIKSEEKVTNKKRGWYIDKLLRGPISLTKKFELRGHGEPLKVFKKMNSKITVGSALAERRECLGVWQVTPLFPTPHFLPVIITYGHPLASHSAPSPSGQRG